MGSGRWGDLGALGSPPGSPLRSPRTLARTHARTHGQFCKQAVHFQSTAAATRRHLSQEAVGPDAISVGHLSRLPEPTASPATARVRPPLLSLSHHLPPFTASCLEPWLAPPAPRPCLTLPAGAGLPASPAPPQWGPRPNHASHRLLLSLLGFERGPLLPSQGHAGSVSGCPSA